MQIIPRKVCNHLLENKTIRTATQGRVKDILFLDNQIHHLNSKIHFLSYSVNELEDIVLFCNKDTIIDDFKDKDTHDVNL